MNFSGGRSLLRPPVVAVVVIVLAVIGAAVGYRLSHTGTKLSAAINPPGLSFPSQPISTRSAPQTLRFSNTSGHQIGISSVRTVGEFAETDNCMRFGGSLGPSTECVVTVTFTPTGPGLRKGALVFTDSVGTQTAPLLGIGASSSVSLTPDHIGFGDQGLKTASAPQTVTLTDTGGGQLAIASISAQGDFAQFSDCPLGGALPAGQACTISVVFTPSALGDRHGALVITDDAGTQTIPLTGSGVPSSATVSTDRLSFGPQGVGTVSAPQTVTVTNVSTVPLLVTGIDVQGDFNQTDNCPAKGPLAAAASCTITVTFAPTTVGPRNGVIKVTGGTGSVAVILSGTGVTPSAALSASHLQFGPQQVGSTSKPIFVSLSNGSGVAVAIGAISTSGDFAQGNTCPVGGTLAAGASCGIAVGFHPTATGTRAGSLTVTTGGAPQTVSLTGTGVAAQTSVTPSALAFGNPQVGSTSKAQAVVVANTGTGPVLLQAIDMTGDFAQADNCTTGQPLAPGATCSIDVVFKPAAPGVRAGTLTVSFDIGAESVALSGNAVAATATLNPASVTFPPTPQGASSDREVLTLTNTGTAPITISSIATTGSDFTENNDCPVGGQLAPGASCHIAVTFTPAAVGSSTGTVTASDDAGNQTSSLSGIGTQ